MNTITVELKFPEDVYFALQSSGLNRDKLQVRATRDLAIQLYSEGRLSLGQAATMANLNIPTFWFMLVERGIPVFDYTEEEYDADLAIVQRWVSKEAKA